MSGSLGPVFLGAIQASASVLLTVFYGVVATQFDLLDSHAASRISRVCVRMFLPALLIVNVGSQLHAGSALKYIPILVWAVLYTFASVALGFILTKFTKLPKWIIPALSFNNTTSLPLLLMQSLASAGVLAQLTTDASDSADDILERAKSYFLVNAVVGNTVTFALGPRLLDTDEEQNRGNSRYTETRSSSESEITINENSSLLPRPAITAYNHTVPPTYKKGSARFEGLPDWGQKVLGVLYDFLNAPLVGGLIGAVIGLTPLHRIFFSEQEQGGYFKAWLTVSIKNIGDLFAALQVVVVGVKLSDTLRRMKAGQKSGKVPWTAMMIILTVRFVIWPAISIGVIYLVAQRTHHLDDDPVLWFAMMLMPTGPPAMNLTSLAEVSGASEQEKMSIAKFLTISYAVSPVMAATVVAALKATQAVG